MVVETRAINFSLKSAEEQQARIEEMLTQISYPGYSIQLHRADLIKGGAQFFLQMIKEGPQNNDAPEKNLLRLEHYSFAVNGEEGEDLVRAVYDQILMLEIHEVGEKFRFRGEQIYHPHNRPKTLALLRAKLVRKGNFWEEPAQEGEADAV